MAYLIVPDIKDEAVVCQGECHHTDCISLKRYWPAVVCGMCGKPMVAGEKYFIDPDDRGGVVHAVCLWEQEEQRRAALPPRRSA